MHTNDRMLDPLAWNEAEFRAAIFAFSVVDADAKNTNFVQRDNSQLDVSLVGSTVDLEGVVDARRQLARVEPAFAFSVIRGRRMTSVGIMI